MPISRIAFDPAPSGSPVSILGPSNKRRRLQFFAPLTGKVTISQEASFGAGQGMVMIAGSNPVTFDRSVLGEWVGGAFFALYTGTTDPVSWIETVE